MVLLAKAMGGFGDTLLSRDAVERQVIHIKGAYIVVRFVSLSALAGAEGWVPTVKLEASLWTGTAAVSVVAIEHAMTIMDDRERVCIIKDVLAEVSLSECGRI